MIRMWIFMLGLLISASAQGQVNGKWYAVLDAMGTKLPLGLEINGQDDSLSGILVSPTQNGARIPMDQVSLRGTKFSFSIDMLGLRYTGDQQGQRIEGIFSQAGADFPLTFTRDKPKEYPEEESITLVSRQQDPTTFPYEREEVTFDGGEKGVVLAGELTLPRSAKAKALIILVSGSGPQDRNAYLGSDINHSPFLVLSDYLTQNGYGVLRYDERGVAESTGDFSRATTADLARDASAALQYLRQRDDLKNIPVGMAGHSEGGLIVPMVAQENDIDFAILLAAPGISIDSLMLEQRRLVYQSMGVPESVIERDEPALRKAYSWIKAHPELDHDAYIEGLYEVFASTMDRLPKALRNSIQDEREFNKQYVMALSSPWMRYFLAIDPTENLQNLNIPVLAMNGYKDTQVPAEMNLNAISQAMAKSGNNQFSMQLFPTLNHLFQPATTGSPDEYGTIETTFDPEALKAITDWLATIYP